MLGDTPEEHAAHWYRTRGLTIFVLAIWAVFALGIHIFASYLNQFSFLGFPLGYYMAVQGSLFIFVVLIFFQNWRQDAIDEDYHQDD
ncbi:MAG: DUF4212 domain-containing protein [Pseudomonadota bacterium]